MGVQVSFLFDTVILGLLTILKNYQALSKFEAVNFTWLSSCQRHVGPIFVMIGGLGLFLGSLPGNQTSFHLWYERWAFMKPLQGNLDFFLIRAYRGPFCLKHKTEGPSHIHITKGKLLWGACGKMAYLFIRRQGISSHLQTIWGARVFHPVALLKLMFL